MSTLKVNKLRDTAGSTDAITLDPNGGAVLAGVTTMTTARVTSGIVTNTFIVGAGVTISESGIEASGIGITCASINGTQIGGRRNLIINGDFRIAQRGTSSTVSGIYTVDRFGVWHSGTDEAPTQAQVDVSSGTTPYTNGFRKALKVTNGNQTGGADVGDYIWIQNNLEAQDIANSGWNYTSSSSFITLQFWVKSSVAQDFKCYLRSRDGSQMMYPFNTGTLTADTWTKVTKTIPGNSGLTFDNDVNQGFQINIGCFFGDNLTSAGTNENAWASWNSSARTKVFTTTWYTTNDATFEITGVQLEVGSQATPFEHRSFNEELALCQRYYYDHANGSRVANEYIGTSYAWVSSQLEHVVRFPVPMRSSPSLVNSTGTNYYQFRNENQEVYTSDMDIDNATTHTALLYKASLSGATEGRAYRFQLGNASAYLHFSAEL